VVSRERLADTETPVSAYLKVCGGRPDSFLLESVENKDVTGRYSIVACDPIFGVELHGNRLEWWDRDRKEEFSPDRFFDLIRTGVKTFQSVTLKELPSVGSLMGFVGYDAVRHIERLPRAMPSTLPVARLVFPSSFIVFDHQRRVMILLAVDSDEQTCSQKVDALERKLQLPLVLPHRASRISVKAPPKDRFCEAVRKGQEYIAAGDAFQVVLSDNFCGESDVSPFEVFRRLRVGSPSPYMFFLDFGGYQLLGCSPETLVKVRDRKVTLKPIAGTRGRSEDPARDKELERDLMQSEKELAEHLMLVDLGRNDAGRVCKYGTVTVEPFKVVERYSHVMHIVSQVQGELREDADVVDAFKAGFPAGTVSGAPKVRAMEIIDELEGVSRGPYAGAVGYFGPNGQMDTCIAIRTVLFEADRFTVRVGAGIVADSVPEMEYKEIANKAAQSLRALEAAARGEK
jgi:anthranilate synthase component 1